MILNIAQKCKEIRTARAIFRKKNKVRWLTIPDSKPYYKATVMTTERHVILLMCYWALFAYMSSIIIKT